MKNLIILALSLVSFTSFAGNGKQAEKLPTVIQSAANTTKMNEAEYIRAKRAKSSLVADQNAMNTALAVTKA